MLPKETGLAFISVRAGPVLLPEPYTRFQNMSANVVTLATLASGITALTKCPDDPAAALAKVKEWRRKAKKARKLKKKLKALKVAAQLAGGAGEADDLKLGKKVAGHKLSDDDRKRIGSIRLAMGVSEHDFVKVAKQKRSGNEHVDTFDSLSDFIESGKMVRDADDPAKAKA